VSIAVPVVDSPVPGTLSIFLPTSLETGCSAHVNAPFFGDMSRTQVDFGTGDVRAEAASTVYNDFLLGQAADLTVSVVAEELAGRGQNEARAIVDLLAPCGQSPTAIDRWKRLIVTASQARGFEVSSEAWLSTGAEY